MRSFSAFASSLLPPHLLMLGLCLLWWSPLVGPLVQVDTWIFQTLNGALVDYPMLQPVFALLNHRKEVWLNLVGVIVVSLCSVLLEKNKAARWERVIQWAYFVGFFQIGLSLQDQLIFHTLEIRRLSPSLVIEPAIWLSQVFDNPKIIDQSSHSFPSGHALAMVYWMIFTFHCSRIRAIRVSTVMIASLFTFPRLFSGAHWLSDCLFSASLAWIIYIWAVYCPLYSKLTLYVRNRFPAPSSTHAV